MVFRLPGKRPRPRGIDGHAAARKRRLLNPQLAAYQRMNPRLFSLAGVLATLFAVLLGGLAWRQILQSSSYAATERKQIMRRVLEPGPRGRILDRNGRVLADNRPNYSVVLYVDELGDEFNKEFSRLKQQWLDQHHDDTTEAMRTINSKELQRQARANVALRYLNQANTLLGRSDPLDEKALEQHFEEYKLLPYRLINNLTPEEYARFNALWPVESPMQTNVEALRYYPYGPLAAHVLGFVGWTNNINGDNVPGADLPAGDNFSLRGMVGRDGLELSHDAELRGQTGGETWVVDPAAALYERKEQQTPKVGADFECSIDLDLQQVMDASMSIKILDGQYDLKGAAVALDVRTGEILAMTSKPDYDLNDTVPNISDDEYNQIEAQDGWLNRATQGLYPAGSTFKLVDTIAGLKAGILDGNTIVNCPGEVLIGGREFKDDTFDILPQGYGNIDLVTAIQKSSDVFYYQEGIKIGPQRIVAEAKSLGLGQATGIATEIPEAAQQHMIIPDPAWKKAHRPGDGPWSDGDTANLAVGQGYIQVTPLQMACMVASIARNETRTHPTFTHNPNLPLDYIMHDGEPLGLTPAERQLLLEGMIKVVGPGGTGVGAQIPELAGQIAGKTGTAQWGPHKDTTIAWFVCFAPVDNPRIAVVVTVESPKNGADLYGATYAVPIARDILQKYFAEHPDALPKAASPVAQN